jgi:GNAT superfamily N-acetyltransferase
MTENAKPSEPGHLAAVVRSATASDLPGLLALYRELRPGDPDLPPDRAEELWARMLADPAVHVVVAERDGVVAASCMLAMVPNLASGGRPIGLVEHVITGARFRRRGLGQAVLRFALDRAWSRACCKVVLLSGVQRPEAHGLYESVGFRGDVERGFVAKPPS